MCKVKSIDRIIGPEYGLSNPSGVIFDNNKNDLYICDMNNGRIVKFNVLSKNTEVLTNEITDNRILRKPLAISMSKSRRLFVADAEHNNIYCYDNNRWEELFSYNNNINLPGSLTFDEKCNLYFSDFLNDRICVLTENNRFYELSKIKCLKPYGIFCYKEELYITDSGNNRIICYNTLNGNLSVIAEGEFLPISVTVDNEGNIYFSEARNLYKFCRHDKKLIIVLNKEIFREFVSTKLCHIGSVTVLTDKKIVFADTIKNSVYEIFLT